MLHNVSAMLNRSWGSSLAGESWLFKDLTLCSVPVAWPLLTVGQQIVTADFPSNEATVPLAVQPCCVQRLNHFTTEQTWAAFYKVLLNIWTEHPSMRCESSSECLQIWNWFKCYKLWYDLNVMSWQLLTRLSVAEKLTVLTKSNMSLNRHRYSLQELTPEFNTVA